MTQRTVTALLLCAAVAVLVAAGIAWAQSSSSYDASWHVLSAGGREGMASESYSAHGSTSQFAIGPAASQNYRVGSGYWYGLPAETPCTEVSGVELTLLTAGTLYTDTLVQFEASISPLNASPPYSYTLDYGDGVTVGLSLSDSNPLAFEHTYASTGTFSAQVAVWNCHVSAPATDSLQVEVSPSQAEPDIVVSPASIDVLLNPDDATVRSLTVGNEGAGNLTWGLAESPEVAWLSATPVSGTLVPAASAPISLTLDSTGLSAGSYTSTLVISNNDPDENPVNVGVTLVVTSAVCVGVTDVRFEYVPTTITAGDTVTFTATYTPDDAWEPVDVAWSFGGTGLQVAHVFTPAGAYTVAVTATNPCGSASFSEQIEVGAPQPPQYDIYLPIIVRQI